MTDTCELSSYAELAALITALPIIVRERRRTERVSIRTAATEIGVSAATLCRLEAGGVGVQGDSLVAILMWLDRAPSKAENQ